MKKVVSVLAVCLTVTFTSTVVNCQNIDEKNPFSDLVDCQNFDRSDSFFGRLIEKFTTKKDVPVAAPSKEQQLKNLRCKAIRSGWHLSVEEDKMLDKSVYIAVKESITKVKPTVSFEFRDRKFSLALILINDEIKNRKSIVIGPKNFAGSGAFESFFSSDKREYLIRIDKNSVRSLKRSDANMLGNPFYPIESNILDFDLSEDLIQEIRNGSKLLIRIDDSEKKDIEWDLSGVAAAWDSMTAVRH